MQFHRYKKLLTKQRLSFLLKSLRVYSSDVPPALRGKTKFVKEKTKELSSRLSTALSDEGPEIHGIDITSRLLKALPRPRLNLDDEVTAIRNISFSSTRETVSYTK